MDRQALFNTVRPFSPNGKLTQAQVDLIDALADAFGLAPVDTGVDTPRRTSQRGIDLIKRFEGLELTAYPDPGTGGEPWTIGHGHTKGVKRGDRITAEQAEAFLREDLRHFEAAVSRLAPKTTQGQFDAMVSLAFNVGEGNLAKSTLLQLHNAGEHEGAAAQFARWNRAAGKVMRGLTLRRDAEAELYLS